MAEETVQVPVAKTGLDAWLDTQQGDIDERVIKLNGEPKIETEPLVPEPAAEPEVPAEPVIEPEAPAVEPEPKEPDPELALDAGEEPPKPKRPRWSDLRAAEKAQKEAERRYTDLEREVAFLKGQMTRPPAPEVPEPEPEVDPDPITANERRTAQLEQEVRELRAHVQSNTWATSIKDQESAFRREHPDYDRALNHYVAAERAEMEDSGAIDALASEVRQRNPQLVSAAAEQTGKSLSEAAKDIAFNSIISAKRDAIVESARRTGKSVAQVAWTLAGRRGYKTEGAEAPPAKVTIAKPDPKLIKEAAQSLSTVTKTPPPPVASTVKLRSELLNMEPMERADFIDRMDSEQPGWLEKLG